MEFIHKLVRMFLHLFCFFPIKKNRIIFTSFKGQQYACNPKYIFEFLYANYGNSLEYIWCLNKPQKTLQKCKNVKIIPYKSFLFMYYQLTAKVVVINHQNPVYIPLRKKQFKINTWHGGGAYKKVGISTQSEAVRFEKYKALCEIQDTDLFISSCSTFTKVMSESQCLSRNIYFESGMPRNDIFFKDYTAVSQKARNILEIPMNKKIVLFAPTFRGNINNKHFDMIIDIDLCIQALQKRFGGEWVFLFRGHGGSIVKNLLNSDYIKDATLYGDMQELLCLADILITDYSSSVWDYSLTGKPGFLFTPDLEEYIGERGFYTPIEKWSYKYAKTNKELEKNILEFDIINHTRKVNQHLSELGSFETGNATKIVSDKILEYLKPKK